MRLCTARNAENNKNVCMKIANRISDKPEVSKYGDEFYAYGDIVSLELCLMPFDTEVEAKSYGASLLGGRRATLTPQQASLFNEFTHIWVNRLPDSERQDSEYIVKDIRTTLNSALLIIDIRDGSNGRL